MPALSEFSAAVRHVGPIAFGKRVWKEVGEDNIFTLASALAYSWLFAIFPFLIFLLSLIPLVMKEQWKAGAIQTINKYVDETLPARGAQTVHEVVSEVLGGDETKKVGLLSVGLLLTIWAASGGMSMTMVALDTAFDAPRSRPFYRQRPLALGLTIIVASMVLAMLILIPIGSFAVALIRNYGDQWLPKIGLDAKWLAPITWAWDALRFSLAFVLMFCVLAIVYHWAPNVKRKLRFLTPGSVFCVAVWIILAVGFRLYIDRFGKYEKTYGTVGGVAILLLFFYIDALVLLIGAEIDAEVETVQKEMILPAEVSPSSPPPTV